MGWWAMRGEVMWLHPHPNLLPKAVVKTVLVSPPIPHPAMVLMFGRPVSVHHSSLRCCRTGGQNKS